MTPRLIGLHGKARSGKDTTADLIDEWCENNDLTFSREAFARRLKESAAAALGYNGDDPVEFCDELKAGTEITVARYIEGTFGPEPTPPDWEILTKITGREYLQLYGTEAHRDVFADDFWVDAVLPTGEGKHGSVFEEATLYDRNGIPGRGASVTPIPDWHLNFLRQDQPTVADICVITDVRFPNEAKRIKDLGGQIWKIERVGAGAGEHASEQELDGDLINWVIDNNEDISGLAMSVDVLLSDIVQERAING